MGRIIKVKDIKKGDEIVIHRQVTVETDLDADGDFKDQYGNWVEVSQFGDPEFSDYSIELVKRPNPELPDEIGSVIRVFSDDSEAVWLLNSAGFWTSSRGGHKPREDFPYWIDSNDFTFEVIL